ncbi:hypothetical protein NDU88_004908 [Pleurodeles waltl]|uniref:Uncharacterized protein n=1 Tax=Pleurodeles waltl TaxID=8319 RepID=A0AAV7RI66_PLEWA|nr:hypothetical protein NDU88_004908 [Pleurodeles waltl]
MGRAGHLGPGRQSCCHHWGPLLGVGWTFLDPPGRCGGVRVCVFQIVQCGCVLELYVYFERGGVYRQWNTAVERPPRGFVGRNGIAYFCWRDGGGLVFASLTLAVGVADFCGCRVFGGLPL